VAAVAARAAAAAKAAVAAARAAAAARKKEEKEREEKEKAEAERKKGAASADGGAEAAKETRFGPRVAARGPRPESPRNPQLAALQSLQAAARGKVARRSMAQALSQRQREAIALGKTSRDARVRQLLRTPSAIFKGDEVDEAVQRLQRLARRSIAVRQSRGRASTAGLLPRLPAVQRERLGPPARHEPPPPLPPLAPPASSPTPPFSSPPFPPPVPPLASADWEGVPRPSPAARPAPSLSQPAPPRRVARRGHARRPRALRPCHAVPAPRRAVHLPVHSGGLGRRGARRGHTG